MAGKTVPQCDVCDAIAKALDALVAVSTPDAHGDVPHVLAGIISWWVKRSLDQFDGDAGPVLTCLENCLTEYGLAATIVPVLPARLH